MPGTAAGTCRRKQRKVEVATSSTEVWRAHVPARTMLGLRSIPSSALEEGVEDCLENHPGDLLTALDRVRPIDEDFRLDDRLAGRRGRIETLLMQKQVDAERVKLGQERHKIFQAAPQAIDVPRHHDVELALGGVPAQCIERRSSIAALSAADAVISVDLRHLPVGPLCRLA